jgi:predicted AAA+ superfamily ATPase
MQVLQGPRQVGKTTVAEQVAAKWNGPVGFSSADSAFAPKEGWIEPRWQALAAQSRLKAPGLLIVDEVQKIPRWSEEVKGLWDAERRHRRGLRVLLLGSSAMLVQKGLTESLAGRFQLHDCQHWPWAECRDAFKMDLAAWIYYGGYPGAAPLKRRPDEWVRYVSDALIESVLARDVLQLQAVSKPALLRQLFGLAVAYPAQILSYTKMLSQLNDAGNTTTLAHYLGLLETAFLASGLQPYRSGQTIQRGGSPKLILWNNALINALSGRGLQQARLDTAWWGRLVENAVGAHLLTGLSRSTCRVFYWRDRNMEVDFVVKTPTKLWALEVKSGRPNRPQGLAAFKKKHPRAIPILIGQGGIELEEFFSRSPQALLS